MADAPPNTSESAPIALCEVCLERLARIGKATCSDRCDATLRKRRSRHRKGIRRDGDRAFPLVVMLRPCGCGCGQWFLVAPWERQGRGPPQRHYLNAAHKAAARKFQRATREDAPEKPRPKST